MRSNLRNLCCTAIGQASVFNLISKDVKDVTQDELIAIVDTVKLLNQTLSEMMKEIKKLEMKEERFQELKSEHPNP